MPPLCARTGRPASKTAKVDIVHTPAWAWFGLVGGLLLALITTQHFGRKATVHLPIGRGVKARQSLAAVGIVVAFLPLFTFALMLAVDHALVGAVGTAVFLPLTFLCGRAYRGAWVRGSWVDEQRVRLTRLDPAFAAALSAAAAHRRAVEERMAFAGWHPDPGGTPALRYFDGVAWTEHLTPAV
jgi:hypothetical protein